MRNNDFLYEYRPFIFLAIGLMAVVFSMSGMMTLAGWVIVACSGLIVHTRLRHRGHIK